MADKADTYIQERLDSLHDIDNRIVTFLDHLSVIFGTFLENPEDKTKQKEQFEEKVNQVYEQLSKVAIDLRKEVKVMDDNTGVYDKNSDGVMILPITVDQKNTTLGRKKMKEQLRELTRLVGEPEIIPEEEEEAVPEVKVKAPEVKAPEVKAPEEKAPEVKAPTEEKVVKAENVEAPDVEMEEEETAEEDLPLSTLPQQSKTDSISPNLQQIKVELDKLVEDAMEKPDLVTNSQFFEELENVKITPPVEDKKAKDIYDDFGEIDDFSDFGEFEDAVTTQDPIKVEKDEKPVEIIDLDDSFEKELLGEEKKDSIPIDVDDIFLEVLPIEKESSVSDIDMLEDGLF